MRAGAPSARGSRGLCSALPAQIALRRDRRLPARRRRLRRAARHRSAGSQLRPHLRLRHRLARLPVLQRRASATSSGPSTRGGRSAGRSGRPSRRSPVSGPPTSNIRSELGRWPAAIGLLAFVWLEIVYGASGGVAVGSRPAHDRRRRPRLQRLHAGDDGAVRGREVVRAGEIFSVYFGMFSRLGSFGAGDGRLGRAAAALGGDALGDGAGLGRGGDRLDRHDQLRRRAGGGLQGRDRTRLRLAGRRRPRPRPPRSASPTRSSWCSASPGSASST